MSSSGDYMPCKWFGRAETLHPIREPKLIRRGQVPWDRVSLFSRPDKSGQVEILLRLYPPPLLDTILKPDQGRQSCATILHNSVLALLEAKLPGQPNVLPLWIHCGLSLPPLHSVRTHSYPLKYRRNCNTEMQWRSQMDHRSTSYFASLPWTPLTSFFLQSSAPLLHFPPVSLTDGLHLEVRISRHILLASHVGWAFCELRAARQLERQINAEATVQW